MNLNQMRRIASKSEHDKYCHSALIFDGPRLLSYGYNFRHIHAEASAIKRLLRRTRIGHSKTTLPNNLHLISFMYKKSSGNMGNSLPCPDCMDLIKTVPIKTITYFDSRRTPWQLIIQ